MLLGRPTGGALGVMVAESNHPGLLALVASYEYASGVVVLSTHPVGRDPVTIRPVESTVGLTAGSFDETLNTASDGNAEPAGLSTPVKT
jgi:hypothetical protein